jgi:uncharacterized membrane protein
MNKYFVDGFENGLWFFIGVIAFIALISVLGTGFYLILKHVRLILV